MSLKNSSAKIKIPKILINKLKDKRITKIYNNFEKSLDPKNNFIVAVSGGPDSLALAFLSKIYSIKNNVLIKYFIIDHKLRSESTNEAITVKKKLNNYKIYAEILTWKGVKPAKNIQAIARKKRYEMLLSKSKNLGIHNILLGHQLNDLFENFFIRMLRGSGLKGLISLDKKTKIKGVNILRPLLYQKKEDLIYIAKTVFNFYVNDPSNTNEKFQRIKIRSFIENLKQSGLDQQKFINTLQNLKHSNEVVNFYVERNIIKNSFISVNKDKAILSENFFKNSPEVIFRGLSDILCLVSKRYYSVRGKKLYKIIDEIKRKAHFKATLGGCIIQKVKQTVIIYREF